jgi:hypothetical protein
VIRKGRKIPLISSVTEGGGGEIEGQTEKQRPVNRMQSLCTDIMKRGGGDVIFGLAVRRSAVE